MLLSAQIHRMFCPVCTFLNDSQSHAVHEQCARMPNFTLPQTVLSFRTTQNWPQVNSEKFQNIKKLYVVTHNEDGFFLKLCGYLFCTTTFIFNTN